MLPDWMRRVRLLRPRVEAPARLARAVDGDEVDEAVEEDAGADEEGRDEKGVVELIDVKLVDEQGVDGAEALGEGCGGARFADVEEPGEGEAKEGRRRRR